MRGFEPRPFPPAHASATRRKMIDRYSLPEFRQLWAQSTKYAVWLDVELAALDAMEEAGLAPKGNAAAIRKKLNGESITLDAARIDEIERTTKHDVIAFLTHVEEKVGEPARWLHLGLTSSDVLDTSFAILLQRSADRLLTRTDTLLAALAKRSREHVSTPIMGRSHGISAEPTTFGVVLAGHYAEIARGRARLAAAREEISVGKLAGAVGTYAHLTPDFESKALATLGLRAETVSTQVVARDRHAAFFSALALLATGIERLATNVRHWQRSEVGEAEEAFTVGQKGSSAMPHKRNPVLSENLCGLARVVRSSVIPALENVALWHERDISHSSVERMIAPDATATLDFMLARAAGLVEGLVVYPENMRRNLERAGELYFSEATLLLLVASGMARQEAYVLVQRNAMKAFNGDGNFKDNLLADSDVTSRIEKEALERAFDLNHALRFANTIVDRALRT